MKSRYTVLHLNYFSFMCGIIWVPDEVTIFLSICFLMTYFAYTMI